MQSSASFVDTETSSNLNNPSHKLILSNNPYDWFNRARIPKTLNQASIAKEVNHLLDKELRPAPDRWVVPETSADITWSVSGQAPKAWHIDMNKHVRRQQSSQNVTDDDTLTRSSDAVSWMQDYVAPPKKKEVFDGVAAAMELEEKLNSHKIKSFTTLQHEKWGSKVPMDFKMYQDETLLASVLGGKVDPKRSEMIHHTTRPPSPHSLKRRELYLKMDQEENGQPDAIHWTREGKHAHYDDRYFQEITFPSLRNAFGSETVNPIIYDGSKSRFPSHEGNKNSSRPNPKNFFEAFTPNESPLKQEEKESKGNLMKWTNLVNISSLLPGVPQNSPSISDKKSVVAGFTSDALSETIKNVRFPFPVESAWDVKKKPQKLDDESPQTKDVGEKETKTGDDLSWFKPIPPPLPPPTIAEQTNQVLEFVGLNPENTAVVAETATQAMGNLGMNLQSIYDNLPSLSGWGGWGWSSATNETPAPSAPAKKKKKKSTPKS
eukprot:GDKK01028894.1.p1 GENE.GDKK01028894.1~~GDKK01028894.1.p1  ORF type:complete len:491 (+),score=96.28 GDKK01028894.1:429-1901(+)